MSKTLTIARYGRLPKPATSCLTILLTVCIFWLWCQANLIINVTGEYSRPEFVQRCRNLATVGGRNGTRTARLTRPKSDSFFAKLSSHGGSWCRQFRHGISPKPIPVTQEELDFPLAFSLVVF